MIVSIEDLKKLEIKIGTVISAEKVENSDKLLKLIIDFGNQQRQIVTGMAEFFAPQHFIGKQLPVVMNLEKRKFKGEESQGMILAADVNNAPVLLHPEKKIPEGSIVK